jgi:hypothetical protein
MFSSTELVVLFWVSVVVSAIMIAGTKTNSGTLVKIGMSSGVIVLALVMAFFVSR